MNLTGGIIVDNTANVQNTPQASANMYDQNNTFNIDIMDILNMVWKYKVAIIISALVFGVAFFVKTYFFTADTYTASGQLCVSNRAESYRADDNGVILKSDLDTAQSVMTTYVELLKMREFLEEVDANTESKIGWKNISRIVSISSKDRTEILTVSATANDPKVAFDIADNFVNCAPSRLQSVYEGGSTRVVNKVYMPTTPNSKGTLKNTAIGLLIGVALGVAYAFLRTLFDRVIHHSADITKRFGLIILGEIADMAENVGGKKIGTKRARTLEEKRFNILNPKSSFDTVETYKSIRTNIMFSIPKSDKGKIIAVCSSAPTEGKSTTSVNLALTFAQTGVKVLLIDCDMRKPQLHHYLNIERGDGVSNILCGFCDINSALRKNVRENLDVLTAGKTPPNPAELLDTAEFGNMLAALQDEYDYIFIDTPPITVVTDAVLCMRYCHGVVVVVRENQTTFDLLGETLQNIERVNANIFGCVVVNAAEKNSKYGYYKHGRYGYYRRSYYSYGGKIQTKDDDKIK